MYKYKREMNNLDEARTIEYSLSDNSKVCFCTTGMLKTEKPYHGMFIKSGKVLLENMVETFDIDGESFKLVEIETKMQQFEKRILLNIILEILNIQKDWHSKKSLVSYVLNII